MAVVICPCCKGKGEVVQIKWLPAIMTLGITALSDLSWPDVCDVCGYLINFLQAKYARFNILERCPRCHAGGFKLHYWESKESESENDR